MRKKIVINVNSNGPINTNKCLRLRADDSKVLADLLFLLWKIYKRNNDVLILNVLILWS